jgi:hypothetical protein
MVEVQISRHLLLSMAVSNLLVGPGLRCIPVRHLEQLVYFARLGGLVAVRNSTLSNFEKRFRNAPDS